MSDSKVSMKLLIDTKGKRVLFAEAGKDCVDFLFHILTLPVATIISLLKTQGMVGSLPNLFKSLETLNDTFIQPNQKKDTYLKPMSPASSSSSVPLLAFTASQIQKKLYRCSSCYDYVSDDPRASCPSCRRVLSSNYPMTFVAPTGVKEASEGGGLVKGVVTYMVMDDLVIEPMSTISSITLLNKFNVKEVGALEEKVVYLGMKGCEVAQDFSAEQECSDRCLLVVEEMRPLLLSFCVSGWIIFVWAQICFSIGSVNVSWFYMEIYIYAVYAYIRCVQS